MGGARCADPDASFSSSPPPRARATCPRARFAGRPSGRSSPCSDCARFGAAVPPHLAAAIALAVWVSEAAIPIFGCKDPRQVTIDEVVGVLTTLALLPRATSPANDHLLVVLGFLFFRIFDILKPPPVRNIERAAPGGLGIVLDDVAAGVYANLSLRIVARLLSLS
jgi:hypothetical protein